MAYALTYFLYFIVVGIYFRKMMILMKKAIFIIPFFNEETRIGILEYQLDFKENQSIDFLLVDDGSTDSTCEILTEF